MGVDDKEAAIDGKNIDIESQKLDTFYYTVQCNGP